MLGVRANNSQMSLTSNYLAVITDFFYRRFNFHGQTKGKTRKKPLFFNAITL